LNSTPPVSDHPEEKRVGGLPALLMRAFWTFCICSVLFCTSVKAELFNLPGPGGYNVVGPFPYGLPLQRSLIVTFSPPDLPAPRDVYSGPFSNYRVDVHANGSHVFFACGSNQGADCGYRYERVGDLFNIIGGPPFVLTENLTIDVSVVLSRPSGPFSFPVHIAIDLPNGYSISRISEIQREIQRRR
jgi:hypothetical protein